MRKVTYATSGGRSWDMTNLDPALMRSLALMSWEWNMDESGAAVREDATYKSNVVFADQDSANAFLDATYVDAAAGHEGMLTIDGWSLSCAIQAGDVGKLGGGLMSVQLQLHSARPLWRRVIAHELLPGMAVPGEGLDLPYDTPYDLAGDGASGGLASLSSASYFLVRCIFWGACEDPWIELSVTDDSGSVTTNRFEVDATAEVGERIIIDPMGRHEMGQSVYLVDALGAKTNLFDKRLRGLEGSGTYIFQQMPAGSITASWPQGYGVTLELIEERGSLPWT